jgi:hypothetical protein
LDHAGNATGPAVTVVAVRDDDLPAAALLAAATPVLVLVEPNGGVPVDPVGVLGSADVATTIVPVTDATKRVDADGRIAEAVDRGPLRRPVLPVVVRADAARQVLSGPTPPTTVAAFVVAVAQLQPASAGATTGGAIPIVSADDRSASAPLGASAASARVGGNTPR